MTRLPSIVFVAAPGPRWAGWLMATVAGACLTASALQSWHFEAETRARAARLSTTEAARSPRSSPGSADRALLLQARNIAVQLSAPWDELLGVFEQHTPDAVGLLKLEPDAKAALVRVTAQAATADAMVAYLAALESDARLTDVILASHQVDRDTRGRPLRFTVIAGWRTSGVSVPAAASTRIAKVAP